MVKSLFHYTDQKGLIGILSGSPIVLWASDIRFLNDSSEYLLALELVKTQLDRRHSSDSSTTNAFIDQLQTWTSLLNEQGSAFVVSFSEDDDSLSQWRAYGGDRGYCLEFDTTRLSRVASLTGFELSKCAYQDDEHEFEINSTIDDVLKGKVKIFRSVRVTRQFSGLSASENARRLKFMVEIEKLLPKLKHKSFAGEREWRLSSRAFSMKGFEPMFRPGRSTLVPYCALAIEIAPHKLPLTAIRVGPNPEPELAKRAIQSLLRAHERNGVDIRSSNIPYRNW